MFLYGISSTNKWPSGASAVHRVGKLPVQCSRENASMIQRLVRGAHRLSAAFSEHADLVAWSHGSSHVEHDLDHEQ